MSKIKRTFTYANLMASLAAFIALGGAAYAVEQAQRNSVSSASIKKGAVKSADVRDGGLSGRDLADGAVFGKDLAPETITGDQLDESTLGEVPSAGSATTATRAATAAGVATSAVTGTGILDNSLTGADIDESTLGATTAGLEVVSATSANNSDSPKTATECPAGKRYVLAGYLIFGGTTGTEPNQIQHVAVSEISPNSDNRRVIMTAQESSATAGNWRIQASILCANAS
jgi:hypothetical protein